MFSVNIKNLSTWGEFWWSSLTVTIPSDVEKGHKEMHVLSQRSPIVEPGNLRNKTHILIISLYLAIISIFCYFEEQDTLNYVNYHLLWYECLF